MFAIHPLARTEFASPTAVRAPAPRCADGNGTLTPLFFSDDLDRHRQGQGDLQQVRAPHVLPA